MVDVTIEKFEMDSETDPSGAGFIYPSRGQFDEGSEVSVLAKPDYGYAFDHWSGDADDDTPSITLIMDSDKRLIAHFVRTSNLLPFDVDVRSYSPTHSGNILMDFDSDGDLDLILNQFDWPPPQDPQPILAFRNDGTGTFINATNEVFAGAPVVSTTARHWAVKDFNGDGLLDLFIADHGQDHEPSPGGQSLIFIQNEAGQLIDETEERLPQQNAFTHNVAAGDIDGDGDVDIYMCNIWGATNIGPRFYLNDGEGFFQEDSTRIPSELTNLRKKYTASLLLDVDQDDDLDLVLGGHDSPGKADLVLMNDGLGFFAYPPEPSLPPRLGGLGFETVAISTADFNRDGWSDLVMSTHLHYQFDPNLQLLINNGDGTFRDETYRIEQDWPTYTKPGCVGETSGWLNWPFIVDSNNDDWPDILVQVDDCLTHLLFENIEGEKLVVVENLNHFTVDDGTVPWALVPGDVDGDGNMDVVLLYTSMTQQVYLRIPPSEIEQAERIAQLPTAIPEPTDAQVVGPPVLVFSDDFEAELEMGWDWVGDEEVRWSLTEVPGMLRFTLWPGYAARRLLRQAPEGDFEITAKVDINAVSNFQQVGLIVYKDDKNLISLVRAFCTLPQIPDLCVGNGLYFDKMMAGVTGWPNFATATDQPSDSFLRIRRVGNTYTAFYSEDGEAWTVIGEHRADFGQIRVGVVAGASSYAITADVDFFKIYEWP
jgi:hypothetical protein